MSDLSFGPNGSTPLPAAAPVAETPGLDLQEIQTAAEILENTPILKRAFNALSAALVQEKEKFKNLSRDCLIMEKALGEIKELVWNWSEVNGAEDVESIRQIISSLEAGTYVPKNTTKAKANPEAASNDS